MTESKIKERIGNGLMSAFDETEITSKNYKKFLGKLPDEEDFECIDKVKWEQLKEKGEDDTGEEKRNLTS